MRTRWQGGGSARQLVCADCASGGSSQVRRDRVKLDFGLEATETCDAAVIGSSRACSSPRNPVEAEPTRTPSRQCSPRRRRRPAATRWGRRHQPCPWPGFRTAPRTAASRGDSSGSCICSSNACASSISKPRSAFVTELSPSKSAATRFASASSRASLAATSTSKLQKGDHARVGGGRL